MANDSPIHPPKDIIGKSIAVPTLVGLTTSCLRTWLPEHGVPIESVHLVEMPQAAVVPALQRRMVDVGLLGEPFTTISKRTGRTVGDPMNAADHARKEFLISVWYASKKWIEADQERAHRTIAAIYETARWANTHHDETFEILVRDGQLDAYKLKGMSRTVYATTLTPGEIKPIFDIAEQYKIFTKPVDAETIISKL